MSILSFPTAFFHSLSAIQLLSRFFQKLCPRKFKPDIIVKNTSIHLYHFNSVSPPFPPVYCLKDEKPSYLALDISLVFHNTSLLTSLIIEPFFIIKENNNELKQNHLSIKNSDNSQMDFSLLELKPDEAKEINLITLICQYFKKKHNYLYNIN